MQASSAQLFALIAPFPRRWWRGLPRRVWCLDRAQGGQQRLSVEGDVEASEQADQGERAFDRVVPGDAERVQSPVDAVLPVGCQKSGLESLTGVDLQDVNLRG